MTQMGNPNVPVLLIFIYYIDGLGVKLLQVNKYTHVNGNGVLLVVLYTYF